MSTPWQQPGPPVPPVPPRPGRPPGARRTSVVGPVVLTAAAALLLVGALVLTFVVARGFVGLVRSDVIAPDGRPAEAVLAVADAPGAVRVELVGGERYAVHLVTPADAPRGDARPRLDGSVLLLAQSGALVTADDPPGVDVNVTVGDLTARTVGAFRAPETGTYQVAVPPADVDGAWVALVPDRPFAPFFAGVMGTVLGVFVVLGLGGVGFGALVGGVVWWVLRVRARRATT